MFTKQQRDALLKGSLSRIICDNTDINETPLDSFVFEKYPSGYISCDNIPSVNLEYWKEEKSEGQSCDAPYSFHVFNFVLGENM